MNNFYNEIIKFGLNRIKFYNNYVESNVEFSFEGYQREIEMLKQKYERDNSITEEDYLNEIDEISSYYSRLDDDIILNHRKAVIFLLFAFLEKKVEIFCNDIGIDSAFKVNDLKGNSPYEKFIVYLKKINYELYLDAQNEINFLDKVRIVRNVITHQNNFIKANDNNHKKLKDFFSNKFELKEHKDFDNNLHYEIILNTRTFINEIFEKIELLMNKLYK